MFECGLKQVDILPLKKLILKSGASITNWKGKDDLSNGDVVVSSNNKLNSEFIKILKKFKII